MNAASGSLSSNVDLDAAKFCGKVKIKGFKRKVFLNIIGIENSLDVMSGCFTFDAERRFRRKFQNWSGKVYCTCSQQR